MRVVVTSYSDGGVHNRYYESKEAAIQAVEEFVSSPPITWGPILYRALSLIHI